MNIDALLKILDHKDGVLAGLKHKPQYEWASMAGVKTFLYHRREVNDDFLYRRSITINAAALEKCDLVIVLIDHRNVCVAASKIEIKAHADVHTSKETKYRYPIERWTILSGDSKWVEKISTVHL